MASDNQDKAVLHYPGGEYEMDIVHATEGNDGVALGKMLAETGLTTLDPGYMNTGSTKSEITFIDGDKGILQYRGYDIADLANNATFNEVSYLLINGELPNEEQKEEFNSNIRKHTLLDEDFKAQFRVFPRDAHPMSVLASSLNILSTYYQDSLDPLNKDFQKLNTYRLMAKVPMLAAYAYRASKGKPYLYPDNSMNARQNFLRQMFGYPTEPFEDDPIVTKALDKLLILHADHEQNCSTSTVRMVGSSQANMFVSIAAGINALSGPLHGGANQAVLEMLEEIQANGGDATDFMKRVKNKEPGVKLMGFGHRVYKKGDSRVPTMEAAMRRTAKVHDSDKWVQMYDNMQSAMSERTGILPNLDFPAGPTYYMLGIDIPFFTPIFVMSRVVGWTAHVVEQNADNALIRPLSSYNGPEQREVKAASSQ